mmetsp:Transcript_51403/g.151514  ORF Transcript_51403/g.151514 Transcript_51403/m.151514 type:complete len:217 (-) Transcript_51403:3-653(-)
MSTQGVFAFVTMMTLPTDFAKRRRGMTVLCRASSSARVSASTLSFSRPPWSNEACFLMAVEGQSVSSQSKMIIVWSAREKSAWLFVAWRCSVLCEKVLLSLTLHPGRKPDWSCNASPSESGRTPNLSSKSSSSLPELLLDISFWMACGSCSMSSRLESCCSLLLSMSRAALETSGACLGAPDSPRGCDPEHPMASAGGAPRLSLPRFAPPVGPQAA